MKRLAACSLLSLALVATACADATDVDDETNTVTGSDVTDLNDVNTDGDAISKAVDRDKGDFGELELGAKIVGPRGPEVKVALSNASGNYADMTSYVACPDGMDPCDPATAPAGTVFTYVHIVYPGEDNDAATGSGDGADASDVERATEFRMLRPAHGFTGSAGYSKAEALAAIGAKADIVMSCDNGALVWTVNAGDGGDQWEQGEPLTFYWHSTLPPAGPAPAYQIEVDGTAATGNGPMPASADRASNACLAPATSTGE
ncbi:hypothetical protein [Erythrobacter litoralis]|uniref:Lipoprotein n=1 Tax=Erythrobacter litoralis (strain HTCC2594) TaxID=314225 RepID=Q2NAR4_ERYLH|nr:hypothetical protein [Erythrobacter litoralis]ABC63227.1 hypothetical protein ELI_05675 [Erythrobacter litoralis HTCC2594]